MNAFFRPIHGSCLLPALMAAWAFAGVSSPAKAGDLFEIQVYQDDVNQPGDVGLEVHTNYTLSGRKAAAYSGEIPPHHVGRLTLEPALGITRFLELGAYLQNMIDADGSYAFAGWKVRAKLVVPREYTGDFFLGLNSEIGKVPNRVEEEGWANEFRPILGWYNGHWLFDLNPIFGYSLTGSDKYRLDLEPAGKVGWNTQKGFMVGVEYYAGLGFLTDPSPRAQQDHLVILTLDRIAPSVATGTESPWEINLGLGRGLTDATPQRWILKAIVGRSF